MFKSIGKLRYSPKLLGNRNEKWWMVLDCDPEIGRYYRYLFKVGGYKKLGRPSWKEHITVVRNEEPPDQYKHLWEKYESEVVEFSYNHDIIDNSIYYWLEVQSPRLDEIRVELGLSVIPEFPFHITIGNSLD